LTAENSIDRGSSIDGMVRPVVLCGGSGSRLWPVSRSLHPKQLLALHSSETMLQATVRRTNGAAFQAPILVTGEDHLALARDQLRAADVNPASIIVEPEARNTAAAIALACSLEERTNPDQLMLVMPSDHVIGDVESFIEAVQTGVPAAEAGAIVTFGIQPSRAETGYGYIEAGEKRVRWPGIRGTLRFVEKPDASTAEKFVAGGNHYWNGGIFLFRASTLMDELRSHAPEIAAACQAAIAKASIDGDLVRPEREAFLTSPSASIDYAIMEKTDRTCVVPVEMRWSDVGSWHALWEISAKNASGNAVTGDVVELESSDCLIRSEGGQTVATFGVRDLVVVATSDAVLVAARERTQDLKTLIIALEEANVDKQTRHPLVHCSWGSYETVDRGNRFETKRIIVKPGEELSLQVDHHRSVHWIVVAGTARATVGEQIRLVQEDESTYIPQGCTHRIENTGQTPLHLIEIKCGAFGDNRPVPVEIRAELPSLS
jgi:mannose-1-phosphate guanylyltransferase/mannose-6-phosphate isomerase